MCVLNLYCQCSADTECSELGYNVGFDIDSVCVLSPNLIFVRGLVKVVPAVARLVCPTHES